MTVGAALLHSRGCLLAVDCRITSDSGTIHSDMAVKWALVGPLTAVFAGDVGHFQAAVRIWMDRGVTTVEEAADNRAGAGNTWEAIIYDQAAHTLWNLDSSGALIQQPTIATCGMGEDLVYGYLRGAVTAQDLQRSSPRLGRHLSDAVQIAAERNATVSASHHVLRCRRKGRPSVAFHRS